MLRTPVLLSEALLAQDVYVGLEHPRIVQHGWVWEVYMRVFLYSPPILYPFQSLFGLGGSNAFASYTSMLDDLSL